MSVSPLPHPQTGPAQDLERPPCPLCRRAGPGEVIYRFPPYAVTRCRDCGLWFLNPRLPEPLMRASYAEDSYFEGGGPGYGSYLAQEPTLRRTFRRFLREMRDRGIAGGRLLEVGCAYGFFLDEAKSYFEHRAGTDYSPAALEKARRRADRIWLGGLQEIPAGESFDCVACIHVIEHVYEPVAFLEKILRHLRPGGWIVLATPDMGGFWRPLMGRRWPFFKIPEHVTFFDRASLPHLLRQSGCDRVESLPYESVFSFDLIAEKLGFAAPGWLRSLPVWLPATTIAAAGRKPL